ncbi:MAG: heparinase II/III family protein [Deltaproteobacteria bacterium]|nr:heparinase II/III family protein [Deltaproteobacteria bacterium]
MIRTMLMFLGLVLLAHSSVWGADGDLLYGPGGADRVRALTLDTRVPAYGAAPADVVARILERAAGFRETTYSYSYADFSYSLGPVQPEPHPDNFPYWTAMFQERADSISTRINTLTFSYLATSQAEDLQTALGMVLDLCAWQDWSDPDYTCYPGPACLDTGHLAMAVAYFYDATRSVLSAGDRQIIVSALTDKGLAPLAVACEYSLDHPAHNLHAIMGTGLAHGAAALMGEDNRASGWMDTAVAIAVHWLEDQGPDGGAIEYHGYGAYALDYLVRLIHVAALQGRTLTSPFLDNVSTFFFSALAPDGSGVGTFGDSWQVCGAQTHLYLAHQGDRLAQAYLVDTGMIFQDGEPGRVTDFISVHWADGDLEPWRDPPVPWASEFVGFAALRSGADVSSTLVVFKSGPPQALAGHNQKDHLSYQIWAKGQWLTGDPGYSKSSQGTDLFRYYDEAFGHSSILLDRAGPSEKNKASITFVAGGAGFGAVCGEGALSYPEALAGSVARCILMNPAGFAVLFDSVDCALPNQVEWLHQPRRYGIARLSEGAGDLISAGARLAVRPVGGDFSAALEDLAHTNGYPETLVLAGAAPAAGVAIGLPDPGFEEADWTGWAPRATTLDAHSLDPDAHTGAQSARITFAVADSGYFSSDRIAVVPGETLRAAAFMKVAQAAGPGARIRLIFWSLNSYLSDAAGPLINGNWDWHLRGISGVVPALADEAALALEFSQSAGSAWFDDVTFGRLAAGEDATTQVRLATLLYPTLAPFLFNGDFAAGLAGWLPRSVTLDAHTIDQAIFRSAPASARIDFPDAPEAGYYYGPFTPVAAADEVRAAAWLKTDITSGSGARLRLLFFQGTTYLDSAQADYLDGIHAWTLQEIQATVPATADRIRLSLELSAQGTAWYDDVEFENLTRPLDPQDIEGPQDISGSHQAFTFTRGDTQYLVLNARQAPVSENTIMGTSQLDQGFGMWGGRSAQLVDGSSFIVGDGTRLELDLPGCLRVHEQGTLLEAALYPDSEGNLPQGVLVEWPSAVQIVSGEVNGEPALLDTSGEHVRMCWGVVFAPECQPLLSQISIRPDPIEVGPGMEVQLELDGFDQFGRVHPIAGEVDWSMLDSLAGQVAPDGLLSAGDLPGFYQQAIQASAEGLTTYADVSVLPECVNDSDCDDSDPCTLDRCDMAVHLCRYEADPDCHATDGGTDGSTDGGSGGDEGGPQAEGCGCGSARGGANALWLLGIAGLFMLRSRRRSRETKSSQVA